MFVLPSSPPGRRARHAWRMVATSALAILAGFALYGAARARSAPGNATHHGAHSSMRMGDTDMKCWSERWFASHPRVGASSAQLPPPAATFTVTNYQFDHDGNPGTQIDVAHIDPGQTVEWAWDLGIHTVTNGEDSFDPNAGTLFNQPIDSGNRRFSFTFPNAGTFPFFCSFHDLDFNMKGTVIVGNPTGVPLPPGEGATTGFAAGPLPNPTRAGVSFRFALREPGRARAEVFDARGRRVAVLVDREHEAGSFSAAWDGRMKNGVLAAAGVYYLRLRLPGYAGSRRIVVAR